MLYNRDFINIAKQVIDPVQMYISRNDGYLNDDLIPSRDILINANILKSLCRYNEEEIAMIERCQAID